MTHIWDELTCRWRGNTPVLAIPFLETILLLTRYAYIPVTSVLLGPKSRRESSSSAARSLDPEQHECTSKIGVAQIVRGWDYGEDQGYYG